MQPTKDPLAMTLMMDDVRQALALHQPSLADTLAAGSLLIRSAYREAAATLAPQARRKLADDIARTVIQQVTGSVTATEEAQDIGTVGMRKTNICSTQ